jgi:hypothetical protein
MHPRLAKYGVPSAVGMEDGFVRNFEEFAAYQADPRLRAWFFLLEWLSARSLAMPRYEATVRALLRKEGLLSKARELEEAVKRAGRCKELSIALVAQAFGLPDDDSLLLLYFNGRERTFKAFPVPNQIEVSESTGWAKVTSKAGTFSVPLSRA